MAIYHNDLLNDRPVCFLLSSFFVVLLPEFEFGLQLSLLSIKSIVLVLHGRLMFLSSNAFLEVLPSIFISVASSGVLLLMSLVLFFGCLSPNWSCLYIPALDICPDKLLCSNSLLIYLFSQLVVLIRRFHSLFQDNVC